MIKPFVFYIEALIEHLMDIFFILPVAYITKTLSLIWVFAQSLEQIKYFHILCLYWPIIHMPYNSLIKYKIQSFFVYSRNCSVIAKIEFWNIFPSPQKKPYFHQQLLLSHPHIQPCPTQLLIYFLGVKICPFWTFCINMII